MKRFITRITKRPALVLLAMVLLAIVFGSAIVKNASLETDLEAYMPSDHPAFVFSDSAEELFGIHDAVLIAVSHPESIYNSETLQKITDLTIELPEEFPQIDPAGVTSLYTADNITSGDWGMEVEPFYTYVPEDPEEIEELRMKVRENGMIFGRVISVDEKTALILAELTDSELSDSFYEEVEDYVRSFEGPETIYIAGQPIVEGALAELGPADMARMAPIVVILMTVILLLLLQSIRDTILNLIIVFFGIAASFGTMALLGVPVYAVDTMIPVMLIAIGVAYGIHLHNSIHHTVQTHPGITKEQLIDLTLKAMIRPVSMAAVTTAIGFTALVTSEILPVRYFGLFASVGVLTEMIAALMLFPVSIRILGIPKRGKEREDEFIDELQGLAGNPTSHRKRSGVFRHQGKIMAVTAILIAFAAFGASKVWIDTSFLANFEPESDIVKTNTYINEHFGGTSTLNVILKAEEAEAFKDPAVLQLMSDLQQEVETHPQVGGSFSIADFIRRMNAVMLPDEPNNEVIPEDRELVAQYLLLYEMSGDPETLNSVVDFEYQTANLTFQLKSDSSALMEEVIAEISGFEDTFNSLDISINYAGSGYKALTFAGLLLDGQIISLGLSFAVVALLLALLFRSALIGIIGTVPIAVTAAVNFGVMGLLNIPLSSATALISSIAIGIGVDYAIHLIEHYRVMRLNGDSIDQSALETLKHTGRAILFNAAAVMGGFAVLMFSVFPPNRQVGGLIALNMAVSAAMTLTVLLIIIVALDRKGKFIKTKPDFLDPRDL